MAVRREVRPGPGERAVLDPHPRPPPCRRPGAQRPRGGEREQREAWRAHFPAFDQVTEEVEAGLEREWVRRCLDRLTDLQRQSVTLAYYEGYTYREVAERLSLPLGTVKTRMRDGLTRMRECLGGVA